MNVVIIGQAVTALTPVLVPLAVALGKGVILKRVPPTALPLVAVVLGALIDVLNTVLTGQGAWGAYGAPLGAMGIGVREVLDQIKKGMAGPPPAAQGNQQQVGPQAPRKS
ncbi:MAG: hypothetical protein ACREM3_28190 [Candidatus Rokuibacteriota bacterium]